MVWHTQGSGKSLTMAFYAGRVILHPAMENPTIVVLTDRNDLDDQLFGRLPAAAICCASHPCRRQTAPTCARNSAVACRRRDLHHHPEVLSRDPLNPPSRQGRSAEWRCFRSGAILS